MEAEPAPRWEVPTPGAPLRLSLLHGLFVLCCERTNTSGSSASFAGTGESLGASPARRGDTLISQSLPRLDPQVGPAGLYRDTPQLFWMWFYLSRSAASPWGFPTFVPLPAPHTVLSAHKAPGRRGKTLLSRYLPRLLVWHQGVKPVLPAPPASR